MFEITRVNCIYLSFNLTFKSSFDRGFFSVYFVVVVFSIMLLPNFLNATILVSVSLNILSLRFSYVPYNLVYIRN